MVYKGSCHCGRVAFEVEGDIGAVIECNCSICSKK
ncbi:MAG TPA: GFA family protein, partial [Usitatibacter sp.]